LKGRSKARPAAGGRTKAARSSAARAKAGAARARTRRAAQAAARRSKGAHAAPLRSERAAARPRLPGGELLTCREFIEFLDAYLDGELSAAETDAFDWHMAACAPCVAYLESYAQTIRLGKMALGGADEPVPAEVPEELVAAILASRRRR
jgi:hypothetical protein